MPVRSMYSPNPPSYDSLVTPSSSSSIYPNLQNLNYDHVVVSSDFRQTPTAPLEESNSIIIPPTAPPGYYEPPPDNTIAGYFVPFPDPSLQILPRQPIYCHSTYVAEGFVPPSRPCSKYRRDFIYI